MVPKSSLWVPMYKEHEAWYLHVDKCRSFNISLWTIRALYVNSR